MFLEAVVTDHSLDSKGFTYFVPESLRESVSRGCVVEVPFGESLEPAVVTEIDAPPPECAEAKSIVSVIVSEPVVAPYQIDAAYDLCRRYFVSFHTAFSFFLPTPVFRRFLKTGKGYGVTEGGDSDFRPKASERPHEPTDLAPNRVEVAAVPSAHAGRGPAEGGKEGIPTFRPVLFYDRDGIGAAKIFGNAIPAEPGTALILPSDSAVDAFLRETALPADSFLIHADSLTEAKDFRLRLSVAARERPFLVWSRRLCSYNLSAYPFLTYFEDALFPEARHKFFHSYDHGFLLESFVRRFGFRLSVSSFIPSSRLMALVVKGEWLLENVPSDEKSA